MSVISHPQFAATGETHHNAGVEYAEVESSRQLDDYWLAVELLGEWAGEQMPGWTVSHVEADGLTWVLTRDYDPMNYWTD